MLIAQVLAQLALGVVVDPAENAPEHLHVATERTY